MLKHTKHLGAACLALAFTLAPGVLLPGGAAAGSTAVDSLLWAADHAAGESRHREAVRLLQAAAAQAPSRTEQISASLAYQLAWAGELKKAQAEFMRATAFDPENYDLRMTELLVWNWRGRHQAAYDGYEALRRRYPERLGPMIGMASARNWQGRDGEALKHLDLVLRLDPQNVDAQKMRSAIRQGRRPKFGSFWDHEKDSDDYQVQSLWIQGTFSPRPGWSLTPHWLVRNVEKPAVLDHQEHWVGTRTTARLWPSFAVWGRLMFLLNKPSEAAYAPWAGDLSGEVIFSDAWAAAVHGERFAAESYQTFPEKITGTNLGASLRFVPDPLLQFRALVDRANYSDDNARTRLQAEVIHELWPPAGLKIGAKAGYVDFERWLDNGIWTPDAWWGVGFTGSIEVGQRDNWAVHGFIETGPSKELGTPSVVYYFTYSLGAYRQLGPRLMGEISFSHREGDLDTWAGYDRSMVHIGLKARF